MSASPQPHSGLSSQTLLELASQAYTPTEPLNVSGFEQIGHHVVEGKLGTGASGYMGAAFWNQEKNLLVIAHSGTNLKNMGDLTADLKILLGIQPKQLGAAMAFTAAMLENARERSGGKSFSAIYTGHSLGGALAQMAHAETLLDPARFGTPAVETVAFDPPGCRSLIYQRLIKKGMDENALEDKAKFDQIYTIAETLRSRITHFHAPDNLVNQFDKHIGTINKLTPREPEAPKAPLPFADRLPPAAASILEKARNRTEEALVGGHRLPQFQQLVRDSQSTPSGQARS